MIAFTTTILQFAEQGEKTGWSYILIPEKLAQQLKPGNRKSFRVKGKLDAQDIFAMALIPMGGGDFIMALNTELRKKIRKNKGDKLRVQIEVDTKKQELPEAFVTCLAEEPKAFAFFKTLAPSHQLYFGKWIASAKTDATQIKRIGHAITALEKKFDFGQMVRSIKANADDRKRG
jgi:hypothetical protein